MKIHAERFCKTNRYKKYHLILLHDEGMGRAKIETEGQWVGPQQTKAEGEEICGYIISDLHWTEIKR